MKRYEVTITSFRTTYRSVWFEITDRTNGETTVREPLTFTAALTLYTWLTGEGSNPDDTDYLYVKMGGQV